MSFEEAVHAYLSTAGPGAFPEIEAFYFSEKDTLSASEDCFLLYLSGEEQCPDVGDYPGTAVVQVIDVKIALRIKDMDTQTAKVQCRSIRDAVISAIIQNRRFVSALHPTGFLVSSVKISDGMSGTVAIKGNGFRWMGFSLEGKFWSET